MLEEEMAFTKMSKFVKLQKDSGLKLSYNDKLNTKTAVEMGGILCKVIISWVQDYCSMSNFFSVNWRCQWGEENEWSKRAGVC